MCSKGQYRQSKTDEWTFTIKTQDITASAGVTVTQTISSDVVVTGTLKTALTGADTKSMVVTASNSGSFIKSTDIVIGIGNTATEYAYMQIQKD